MLVITYKMEAVIEKSAKDESSLVKILKDMVIVVPGYGDIQVRKILKQTSMSKEEKIIYQLYFSAIKYTVLVKGIYDLVQHYFK